MFQADEFTLQKFKAIINSENDLQRFKEIFRKQRDRVMAEIKDDAKLQTKLSLMAVKFKA